MKKNIVFVISRLAIGGAQKSMLKALSVLDYSKYNVTLYIRERKLDLLSDVPKEVNVLINDDKDYNHRLIPLTYEVLNRIGDFFNIKKLKCFALKKSRNYVVNSRYRYEKKKYFSNGITYDIAISYVNGYNCEFVADFIDAKKKICFYLGSSDGMPELHKRCLPVYDSIVSDSDGTAKFLKENIPSIQKKITVITNYVDYEEVCAKAKESDVLMLDRKENVIVLCSCGRLSGVKGFDLAIEAAKLLKEQNFPFLWYFVGDGEEREKIDKLIDKYGLNDNIYITGLVNNPYPYIKNCDIYVQPSYEESFGLTITEAKILCKPIVSTRTVGGEHQITHMTDGILTDFTADDIAKGIIGYYKDKELADNVINNLNNIDYSKDYQTFCQKWEKLLEGK